MNSAPATILIVDDNPVNRKLLLAILQAEGYATLEASDGEEGLEIIDATIPNR